MPGAALGYGTEATCLRRRGLLPARDPLAIGASLMVMLLNSAGAGAQEAAAEAEALIPVPSGQAVRYLDTVQSAPGPEGLTIRFRFVAPAIAREGGTVDPETAHADMEVLCNDFALPRLPKIGPAPSQIIVSLADRAMTFGEPAPEVTQFFEAYTVRDGRCVWEAF